PAQFVADDWAAVGIRCIIRERNRPLFYAEKDSMSFDFNVWTSESDYAPLLSPRYFFAFHSESFYAPGWGKWYQRGGLYDMPESRSKGSIPVPKDHPMYEAMVDFDKALLAPTFEVQKKLIDAMLDIAAENTWSISIATAPPQLVVVKNGFRNVPKIALSGNVW